MTPIQQMIDGVPIWIDPETGFQTQAPTNDYSGQVQYSQGTAYNADNQAYGTNTAQTIAGQPADAYKIRPSQDVPNHGLVEVLNPATGAWEEGLRMPFEIAGGSQYLPSSIGKDMGGAQVRTPPKDGLRDLFGSALPFMIAGFAGAAAGGVSGAQSWFNGGNSPLTVAGDATGVGAAPAYAGNAGISSVNGALGLEGGLPWNAATPGIDAFGAAGNPALNMASYSGAVPNAGFGAGGYGVNLANSATMIPSASNAFGGSALGSGIASAAGKVAGSVAGNAAKGAGMDSGDIWGKIASIGAPIVGGLIGANAANSAADTQASAADRAAALSAEASNNAIAEQKRQYDTTRADLAPYREAGTSALSSLKDLMSSGSLTRKFTLDDFWSDPVTKASYQSGLDLGTQAINNMAGARGGRNSGATLKALDRFGTDYTGNQAAGSQARFVGDQNNTFNKYANMAGIGQTATNTGAQAGSTAATNIGNIGTANANTVGNLYTGAANARGAAAISGANSLSSGVNSVANWYNSNDMLNKILASRTGGNAVSY